MGCVASIIGTSCGTDETQIRQLTELQISAAREVINKKISNTMQTIKATSANYQRITCVAGKDCNISNIKMEQYATIDNKGRATLEKSVKSESIIDSVVDAGVQAYLDYINRGTTGGDRKTLTNAEARVVIETKTQLKSILTDNSFSSCVASAINEQIIEARTIDGSVTIQMIHMNQTSSVISDCIINTLLNALNNVKLSEETKAALASENSLMKSGDTGNLTEAAMSLSTPIIIGIIVFVLFFLFLIGIFIAFKIINISKTSVPILTKQ